MAKGDSPLTPTELLKLRGRLLSSNSLFDFEIWVMIIIACRLFLREDEVSSLKIEDVVPEITSVKSNGYVEGIAFQIQGKCDPQPVTLMMWADPNFPNLCPINALLAWLSLSKIKGGFIFPSFTFISQNFGEAHWDGTVKEKEDVMQYSTFLDRLKKICKQLLDRSGPFGTHTCRKTGYLLGVWGGGGDMELMQAARHRSVQNAMKYKKDSQFLLDLSKSSGNDVSMGTPVWRAQYCENFQLARSVNGNIQNFTSLEVCAQNFKALSISKIGKDIKTPLEFAEACSLSLEDVNEIEKTLSSLLERVPDAATAQQIKNLFSKMRSDLESKEYREIVSIFSEEKEPNSTLPASVDSLHNARSTEDTQEAASANEENANAIENQNKKRKRGGDIELQGYKELSKIKDRSQKLDKIIELFNSVPDDVEQLTNACRIFYYESLRPIYDCFKNHCNSSREVFVKKWPSFSHSKFKSKCPGVAGQACRGPVATHSE
jgi:hypothetical protein